MAKVRCDLSIPAIYFSLTRGGMRHAVEEDGELTVDPSGELVAVRVFFFQLLEEYPSLPVSELTHHCTEQGWNLCRPDGVRRILPQWDTDAGALHSVYKEFRKPHEHTRRLLWPMIVDVDERGFIVGFELLLMGNTDGKIRIDWLCSKRATTAR